MMISNIFYARRVEIAYELLINDLDKHIDTRGRPFINNRAGVVVCSAKTMHNIALPHAGLVDLGVDFCEVHRIDIASTGHNEPRAVAEHRSPHRAHACGLL